MKLKFISFFGFFFGPISRTTIGLILVIFFLLCQHLEKIVRAPPRAFVKSLDLSWCGPYGGIAPETFLEWLLKCGDSLEILRLSCVDFVDKYCLYMMANCCSGLIGEGSKFYILTFLCLTIFYYVFI